jgi:alpha-tubulin suppressor-like RCC1 family protein
MDSTHKSSCLISKSIFGSKQESTIPDSIIDNKYISFDSSDFNDETICHVSCSACHAVFVTTIGHVYCVGSNTEGECGLGNVAFVTQPTQVTMFSDEDGNELSSIDMPFIIESSCSARLSVLLDNQGAVYFMGSNDLNRMGKMVSKDQNAMRFVYPQRKTQSEVNNEEIVAISTGVYHTLYLTKANNMFITGYNYFGFYPRNIDCYAVKVKHDYETKQQGKKVVQIDCGNCHLLALLEDGLVISSGSNVFGQTTRLSDTTPEADFISFPNDIRIARVCAASYHSFFIAVDGSIFTCGTNGSGQTIVGNPRMNTLTRIDHSQYFPLPVRDISCANHYSMFILKDDSVYICGNKDDYVKGNIPKPMYIGRHYRGYKLSITCGEDGHVLYYTPEKDTISYAFPTLRRQMLNSRGRFDVVDFKFHHDQ